MFISRVGFVVLLALTAWLVVPRSGIAQEEAVPASDYVCNAECQFLIQDWISNDAGIRLPDLNLPRERFDSADGTAACSVERDVEPKVHAVVLAPDYPNYIALESTGNDARLLESFFAERGVDPRFTTIATGTDVTRERMLTSLRSALSCVHERDQMVLVLTGHGMSYSQELAPDLNTLIGYRCEETDKSEALQLFCNNAANFTTEAFVKMTGALNEAFSYDGLMLFLSSETKANPDDRKTDWDGRYVGLASAEISNFVTEVRNRGADAFVVIDASFAADFDLLTYQRYSVDDGGWFWDPAIDEKPAEKDFNANLSPLYGSGHFAALYASGKNEIAYESNSGENSESIGQFILTFTETLREEPDIWLSDLAERVAARMRDTGALQTPVFSASSTGLQFLVPATADTQPDIEAPTDAVTVQAGQVEIISPTPKRGAAAIEEKTFKLVARYDGPETASKAIVDGEIVDVDANGQFSREVTDTGGKLKIQVRVLGSEFQTLAATELKLREAEDEPVIATSARKIALVIANQNYGDGGFAALKTPLADAEAISAILKMRFGFETSITTGGKTLDLFLKDANKAQIQKVLYQLRRQLTPEDQLIVYYAGHGENDPDLGAYWVPVDGLPKADFTWIAADEITRELKRMNAASVLVISDSCYAGGLSRGGGDTAEVTESRARYLAKASRMKARQLMASGGEEPVEDGGGGGHSVFAKALIDALQSMPEQTFTASELFEQKVKPAMISAANALTEGQTPGFSRIARAGDEPGSEFVFQSAATVP